MKTGFTLLELVVVVIIIGVLATLGFTQYTKMVEKGRTAEAKMILGQIRSTQQSYLQQWGNYAAGNDLSIEIPTACAGTHYFSYDLSTPDHAHAFRCTSGGKTPNFSYSYDVSLYYGNGNWSGDAGYY